MSAQIQQLTETPQEIAHSIGEAVAFLIAEAQKAGLWNLATALDLVRQQAQDDANS